VTAAGVAVAVVARAGTASSKQFLVIGAALAAALVTGHGNTVELCLRA